MESEGTVLVETLFLSLRFVPVCLTIWRRREVFLKVLSTDPQVVEVSFGNPQRKLRDVTYLHQLQNLYKSIYDEDLLLK